MGLFREKRDITAGSIIAAVNAQRMQAANGAAPVTVDTAMTLSAVWACIRLLAGVGSTLPLYVYRDAAGATNAIDMPSLFKAPQAELSLSTWLYQVWSSLLTDGNAYGLVTGMSPSGWPTSVELIDPAAVRWRHLPDGTWESRVDNKPLSRWPEGPLWHVPLFTMPGAPFGQSPIGAAKQTIGAGLSAEQFGADFFNGGGNPNAIISSDTPLTASQAQDIKDAFVNATRNNREPAIMGSGLHYDRVQINPQEAQFLDSQRFSVEQIARVYGVPVELIGGSAGGGGSLTYANREQRSADFITYGLMPYLVPLEDALSGLVPRPQRVKFNVDALLRSDLQTRYGSYLTAVDIGTKYGVPLLTVNEMRALEDLPPLDGGDAMQPWPNERFSYTGAAPVLPGAPDVQPPAPAPSDQGLPE
jgi:HK97 family phage portal protein